VATGTTTAGEDRIGNYRIVRVLQMGQNSVIMEVVQEGSGRRFALKELLESRASDSEERKALAFEAKLGMQFTHPNLIRVHEFVNAKPSPYFVMDYFPGMTLRLVVGKPQEYALPVGRPHTVLRQSAEALAYMHEKGWAHRDVKPENILVNKSGEVRVIDYALAKKIPTGLGKLFAGKPPREGTYSYISPDVIRRMPPSAASDIYSFGVTCYELATGRHPFRANSPMELLNKHMKEKPVPPSSYNKAITREYSDLVMKMLAKKPDDRIKDLREFLAAFNRVKIFKDDPDPSADRASF
jgi:serine/threonine protein kinase